MAQKIRQIGGTTPKMAINRRHKAAPAQQRKIPPKRRSVSGVYAFRRKRSIPYESSLERDFIIRAEFFLDTLDIIPQPVIVPFTGSNGNGYHYTPDFLILRRPSNQEVRRNLLVEVKYREAWQEKWREWSTKWKAARRYARDEGWQFRVQDEFRIRDRALENIRWLARFKRTSVDNDRSERILEDLESLGSATVHSLLERHFSEANATTGLQHLWALLAQRHIDCDISRPLDRATELRVPLDG